MFAVSCAAVLALEWSVVLLGRASTFRIEGERVFDVADFADGAAVTHSFLMDGDGLEAIHARFSSTAAVTARVQWTLWRGTPDAPEPMALAFEHVGDLVLQAGRQWRTWRLTRDGSSRDRWYTLRLRLVEPRPAPFPQVTVVASHDNPDRGGVFWINDVRQPGSLALRAERRGRTIYRQFRAVAEPHLPALLQLGWLQWAIVALWHWAVMVFAHAMISSALERPPHPTG